MSCVEWDREGRLQCGQGRQAGLLRAHPLVPGPRRGLESLLGARQSDGRAAGADQVRRGAPLLPDALLPLAPRACNTPGCTAELHRKLPLTLTRNILPRHRCALHTVLHEYFTAVPVSITAQSVLLHISSSRTNQQPNNLHAATTAFVQILEI